MRSKFNTEGTAADLIAEMRAIVDDTRKAIETSQAILDRCAGRAPEPDAAPRADAGELLGAISDGLVHAYGFAKQDGDALTVTLIERALFHVGRRLALGMSPAEAGLVCH